MAKIPPPNVPLVDQRGNLTQPWYRYLAGLERTASEAGDGEIGTAAGSGLEGGGAVSDGVDLSIAAGGVTDAMLRDGLATSVIGRFQNSPGPIADIQAVADERVFSREGGQLAFRSFLNGISIGPTNPAPVRCTTLRIDGVATAAVVAQSHHVPVSINGVTYKLLLST
jgi:hypothetical protein